MLVCSGLDHARRGFESFARECFEALRAEPGVDLELVKASGRRAAGERVVPALRRDHALVRAVARAVGARSFRLEALAFAVSVQPLIARRRPDVVYFSEWDTGRGLAALRALTRQRHRLVLCNGTLASRGFGHLDLVQELTPAARDYVIARGADPARHTVLPLGFQIARELTVRSPEQRSALRERLGLPADRVIVISVAALNRQVKRLDYLIEEVATLPRPRPFVLLVGEPDDETPDIRALARARLGPDAHDVRTVPAAEVPDLLQASDLFVLTSLIESQGRALIEAASHGLPCLAHDSPVMRFALGDHGIFGDFTRAGSLTRLLRVRAADPEQLLAGRPARHHHVYERFSWDRLRPRYVEFLTAAAAPRAR